MLCKKVSMGIPRKWLIGGSIASIVFTTWGIFGWGRAMELFPQNENQAPVTQEAEGVSEGTGEPKLLYDATTYRRAKPLKDPFQMEGIAKISSEMKEKSASSAPVPLRESNAKKRENAKPREDLSLQGILSYNGSVKALISTGGETITVGEGESVKSWTITSIKQREVTLARNGETKVLTLS